MNQQDKGSQRTGYLSDASKKKLIFSKHKKPRFKVSNLSFILTIIIFFAIVFLMIYMLNRV